MPESGVMLRGQEPLKSRHGPDNDVWDNDDNDTDDCDDNDDDDETFQVLTDPHSPAQFRVNGPLANLREFSQVRIVTHLKLKY